MEVRSIKKEEAKLLIESKKITSICFQLALVDLNPIIFLGIFADDNQLKGLFLLQKNKRLNLFNQLSVPEHYPKTNFWYPTQSTNPAKVNTEQKKVMAAIATYLSDQKKDIINVLFPTEWIDFQPFFWNKFKVITRQTYQLNLTLTEETLFNHFAPERKKNITQAQKGDIVLSDNKKDALHVLGMNSIYKPFFTWLTHLVLDFCTEENSIIKVAYHKNTPISTSICLLDSDYCYYMYGAHDSNLSHQGASSLCIWDSMKEAKKRQIPTFDLEGSMVPDIEKFFRNFGGDLVPFYQVTKAPLILEILLKFKNRPFF